MTLISPEDARDAEIARERLAEIEADHTTLISGEALKAKLDELLGT